MRAAAHVGASHCSMPAETLPYGHSQQQQHSNCPLKAPHIETACTITAPYIFSQSDHFPALIPKHSPVASAPLALNTPHYFLSCNSHGHMYPSGTAMTPQSCGPAVRVNTCTSSRYMCPSSICTPFSSQALPRMDTHFKTTAGHEVLLQPHAAAQPVKSAHQPNELAPEGPAVPHPPLCTYPPRNSPFSCSHQQSVVTVNCNNKVQKRSGRVSKRLKMQVVAHENAALRSALQMVTSELQLLKGIVQQLVQLKQAGHPAGAGFCSSAVQLPQRGHSGCACSTVNSLLHTPPGLSQI